MQGCIIGSTPRHGRCPLCGQRTVTTLDHHLPHTLYSSLAVVPVNLIPSCSECNKAKGQNFPTSSEDQAINPYFDDFDQDIWVKASIVEDNPPAVLFQCEPPSEWGNIKSERMKNHFQVMGLATLYTSHASEELVNIREILHRRLDFEDVKRQLLEMAESYQSVQSNSWQTAMYAALYENEWYCNGGFDF